MNLKTHFELEIHFINWHEKSQYSNNSSQTSITLYIANSDEPEPSWLEP